MTIIINGDEEIWEYWKIEAKKKLLIKVQLAVSGFEISGAVHWIKVPLMNELIDQISIDELWNSSFQIIESGAKEKFN